MLSREELKQIPLRYRWLIQMLMKFPNLSFPYFVFRKLPEIEGVFWAVIAPIVLIIYFFFSIWLVAVLSIRIIFPLNLLIVLFIPAIILVFLVRIQLERTILWWKNLQSHPIERDASKIVKELAELFKKQQKKADDAA